MLNFKKIFSICVLSFMLFNILLNSVFADSGLWYSKEVRTKIIDKFKDTQYNYIFENEDNVILKDDWVNFFDTANKIQVFEKLKQTIWEKTDDLSIKNDIIKARTNNLQQAISELDSEIEAITMQIVSINNNIENLNKTVEDTKAEIEQVQKEINENKQVLLEYISHIYKKSNLLNTWESVDWLKTIIMNSDNLWDVLNDVHFSSILEVAWQGLIEKHRDLMKKLFLKKIELENTSKKLEEDKAQVITDRKTVMEKRNFREKILEFTKWQQDLYEQFLEQNEEVDKNLKIKILQNQLKLKIQKQNLLKKYNCKYVDEETLDKVWDLYLDDEGDDTSSWSTKKSKSQKVSNEQQCLNLNKILQNESKLKSLSWTWTNVLSWPLDPTKWLSAYYKDPEYQDVVWSSHDAIDIRTPQWTEIKAPADWYVTFVREPNDSGYAYVVLKHADWFVTVYGHVNEVLVKKYDFVKAWDVFAKSWWEPWTNWAGPMTTWPHLHMEVFKDKQSADPLDYLDLTVLWEKNIPVVQKYVYKYIDDYKTKFWNEYSWELTSKIKIFKLTWETEVDRQKDLLSKYATNEFNNWDMWVEEAIDWNIDPSFLMCIWLAETSLWRNLKTWYNVWNIWNTDSWDTQTFSTPRNWVYWMAKTLNNRFLGKYDDMSMLSRYWNKTWAIYASSDFNWHNNIKKCLTALKWTNVPDNYNFRVWN